MNKRTLLTSEVAPKDPRQHIIPFINSFHKYLLSAHYVSSTCLKTGDIAMTKKAPPKITSLGNIYSRASKALSAYIFQEQRHTCSSLFAKTTVAIVGSCPSSLTTWQYDLGKKEHLISQTSWKFMAFISQIPSSSQSLYVQINKF